MPSPASALDLPNELLIDILEELGENFETYPSLLAVSKIDKRLNYLAIDRLYELAKFDPYSLMEEGQDTLYLGSEPACGKILVDMVHAMLLDARGPWKKYSSQVRTLSACAGNSRQFKTLAGLLKYHGDPENETAPLDDVRLVFLSDPDKRSGPWMPQALLPEHAKLEEKNYWFELRDLLLSIDSPHLSIRGELPEPPAGMPPLDAEPLTHLKSLELSPKAMLLAPLRDWSVKSICASPITKLSLTDWKLSDGCQTLRAESTAYAAELERLTLPALEELRLSHTPDIHVYVLVPFLVRHPSLRVLNAEQVRMHPYSTTSTSSTVFATKERLPPLPDLPTDALPNLKSLTGDPHFLAYVLDSACALPSLTDVSVWALELAHDVPSVSGGAMMYSGLACGGRYYTRAELDTAMCSAFEALSLSSSPNGNPEASSSDISDGPPYVEDIAVALTEQRGKSRRNVHTLGLLPCRVHNQNAIWMTRERMRERGTKIRGITTARLPLNLSTRWVQDGSGIRDLASCIGSLLPDLKHISLEWDAAAVQMPGVRGGLDSPKTKKQFAEILWEECGSGLQTIAMNGQSRSVGHWLQDTVV